MSAIHPSGSSLQPLRSDVDIVLQTNVWLVIYVSQLHSVKYRRFLLFPGKEHPEQRLVQAQSRSLPVYWQEQAEYVPVRQSRGYLQYLMVNMKFLHRHWVAHQHGYVAQAATRRYACAVGVDRYTNLWRFGRARRIGCPDRINHSRQHTRA